MRALPPVTIALLLLALLSAQAQAKETRPAPSSCSAFAGRIVTSFELSGCAYTKCEPLEEYAKFKSLTDINDIRVFGGFEWNFMRGVRDVKSFIELGYVWDRQIVYTINQAFNYKPNDTMMIRAGFSL